MNITDKRNVTKMDAVPEFGDLLKATYKDGEVLCFLIVPTPTGTNGKLLFNVQTGNYWQITPVDEETNISSYFSLLDDDGYYQLGAIDHLPSSKLELVIGG